METCPTCGSPVRTKFSPCPKCKVPPSKAVRGGEASVQDGSSSGAPAEQVRAFSSRSNLKIALLVAGVLTAAGIVGVVVTSLLRRGDDRRGPQSTPRDEATFQGRPTSDWARQLRDKDPRTREEAVKALTNIGSAAVPILSAALRDGDLEARAGAVSALHRIGYARLAADGGADPSISGALAAALEDQHASIRLAAVRALRELGVTDLPALVRRLTDPDQEVREWVAGSLKDLGPRSTQAVEPLIDLLGFYFSAGDEGGRQSTWVQNEAAQALLRIGQTVVPALEQKLGNPNSGLQRSNIEWVLARLKGR